MITNEIRIGKEYSEILVYTNGKLKGFFTVTNSDLEKVKYKRWNIDKKGYVSNCDKHIEVILLHRFILNLPPYKECKLVVDHIDGNPSNNKRENLRVCTHTENCRNTKTRQANSNGVIGVYKDKRCKNSWRAKIYIDKSTNIEKTYKDEELAIIQRLVWELEYFGEFSPQLNLIKEKYSYLLGYMKIRERMKFTTDILTIKEVGESLLNDPHCPCMLIKTEDTLCPCLPCRNKDHCHCIMYIKKEEV